MNVGHVQPLIDLGWVGDDGVCTKYVRDARECSIYADRPMICRIDEGRPLLIKEDEWVKINLAACDELHLKVYGVERERDGECHHAKE